MKSVSVQLQIRCKGPHDNGAWGSEFSLEVQQNGACFSDDCIVSTSCTMSKGQRGHCAEGKTRRSCQSSVFELGPLLPQAFSE